MFRCYENPISTGEEKRLIEVELCQMADFCCRSWTQSGQSLPQVPFVCKRHQDVFVLPRGVFDNFSNIQQVPEKRKEYSVLVVEMLKTLSGRDLTLQQDLLLSCLTLFLCLCSGGVVLPRILDRGVPLRFVNPNPT